MLKCKFILLLTVSIIVLLCACQGDFSTNDLTIHGDATHTPTSSATPISTPKPTPTATPIPTPEPTPTPQEETEPMDIALQVDTAPVESLQESYPLSELEEFFISVYSYDAGMLRYDDEKTIRYPGAKQRFPASLLRCYDSENERCYSIYRVAEGGYFYVFWSWWGDIFETRYNLYIPRLYAPEEFAEIKIGDSFADVQKIAPELREGVSSSYSSLYVLLSSEKVLEFVSREYDKTKEGSYRDIITEINEVPIPRGIDLFDIAKEDFPS